MSTLSIPIPNQLPFLQVICWQGGDVHRFSPQQALNRYERGWHYRGVLGELGAEERIYVRCLAQTFGSWICV